MRTVIQHPAGGPRTAHSAHSAASERRRAPAGRCSSARSPLLLPSVGANSLLGLIKPTDPLLLIDFLIINSVCPSISLRRWISPHRAEVLLLLSAGIGTPMKPMSTMLLKTIGSGEYNRKLLSYSRYMHSLRHGLPINKNRPTYSTRPPVRNELFNQLLHLNFGVSQQRE